jgi:hypothetical protein
MTAFFLRERRRWGGFAAPSSPLLPYPSLWQAVISTARHEAGEICLGYDISSFLSIYYF